MAFGQWVVAATYAYFWDVFGLDGLGTPLDARRNLVGLEVTGELTCAVLPVLALGHRAFGDIGEEVVGSRFEWASPRDVDRWVGRQHLEWSPDQDTTDVEQNPLDGHPARLGGLVRRSAGT